MTRKIPWLLLALIILGECYWGFSPQADRLTWFMENAPVFVLVPIIMYLHPKLHFSILTLIVLSVHALVLMVGGHYTYAKVPIGFWAQDAFSLSRNHYDRIGHLMQGFGPAIALRELLLKLTQLRRGFFLSLVVVSMCLAFSAIYEMIEWGAAVVLGQGAEAFLGTQGDQWDTQWDMFMALIGATIAVTFFGKLQDREITKN